MEKKMLTGRCLCGECSYEIDGDAIVVAQCYCLDCQRTSGTGHSTGAMFAEDGVRISGNPATFSVTSESGNAVTRLFCGTCGSPLFGKNTGMPGFVTVTMGTLDTSDDLLPQVAIFTRTSMPWDTTSSSVQSYEAQPSWRPADPV